MADTRATASGRRVFREEVKEHLINAILQGRLKPGERIVETRVARQLGVSQGPVREALRDLGVFGFVTNEPFRGTFVREISRQDLVEVYPVRAALEALAARTAAPRITEAHLDQLEEYLTRMREAAAEGDSDTHAEADVAFHEVIISASGNRTLRQIWEFMRLSTTTYMTATLSHRPLGELAERHVELIEAMRSRNPERAEMTMRWHIEELGEWVLTAMDRPPDGEASDVAVDGVNDRE